MLSMVADAGHKGIVAFYIAGRITVGKCSRVFLGDGETNYQKGQSDVLIEAI
jgi:hypothetical protein